MGMISRNGTTRKNTCFPETYKGRIYRQSLQLLQSQLCPTVIFSGIQIQSRAAQSQKALEPVTESIGRSCHSTPEWTKADFQPRMWAGSYTIPVLLHIRVVWYHREPASSFLWAVWANHKWCVCTGVGNSYGSTGKWAASHVCMSRYQKTMSSSNVVVRSTAQKENRQLLSGYYSAHTILIELLKLMLWRDWVIWKQKIIHEQPPSNSII